MRPLKFIAIFMIATTCSLFSATSFSNTAVVFFASNNTKEIDPQTAFNRLVGPQQTALKNTSIDFLQLNHVEQSTLGSLLGTYKMSSDQQITADNTETLTTSPYEDISDDTTFSLAQNLAKTLEQESVAIYIPSDQLGYADTLLTFKSQPHSISDTLKMLHEKLPAPYTQALSLYLDTDCKNFQTANVLAIEWLGSHINPETIQSAFPNESVSGRKGRAYLVYADGRKTPL